MKLLRWLALAVACLPAACGCAALGGATAPRPGDAYEALLRACDAYRTAVELGAPSDAKAEKACADVADVCREAPRLLPLGSKAL